VEADFFPFLAVGKLSADYRPVNWIGDFATHHLSWPHRLHTHFSDGNGH
jgi:hypothetical protein